MKIEEMPLTQMRVDLFYGDYFLLCSRCDKRSNPLVHLHGSQDQLDGCQAVNRKTKVQRKAPTLLAKAMSTGAYDTIVGFIFAPVSGAYLCTE